MGNTKAPARAPSADGRQFLERIPGTRKRPYQFTAIDDCTRLRVLKIYDACNQATAIRFVDEVLRGLPFRGPVVQADNGDESPMNFHWHLESDRGQVDLTLKQVVPACPGRDRRRTHSQRLGGQCRQSPRWRAAWPARCNFALSAV